MKIKDLFEDIGPPILFHGANPFQSLYIFKNDMLANAWGARNVSGKRIAGISTTRNTRIVTSKHGYGPWVFVLDRNKLNSRFKIIPVDAEMTINTTGSKIPDRLRRAPGYEHSEELIATNKIENLHSYLKEIWLITGSPYEEDEDNDQFYQSAIAAKQYSHHFNIPIREK